MPLEFLPCFSLTSIFSLLFSVGREQRLCCLFQGLLLIWVVLQVSVALAPASVLLSFGHGLLECTCCFLFCFCILRYYSYFFIQAEGSKLIQFFLGESLILFQGFVLPPEVFVAGFLPGPALGFPFCKGSFFKDCFFNFSAFALLKASCFNGFFILLVKKT